MVGRYDKACRKDGNGRETFAEHLSCHGSQPRHQANNSDPDLGVAIKELSL